jgi:hypothetical protein
MRLELTKDARGHMNRLAALPYVTKVLASETDTIKRSSAHGVLLDPRCQLHTYVSQNTIPLFIIDPAAQGRYHLKVCATPGHYEEVFAAIGQYILDGSGTGRITHDPEIASHLYNIRSLEEVDRMERGLIVEVKDRYQSGIYDVARLNGHVHCTICGESPGLGLSTNILAISGRSGDLEYILQNYTDYFRSV